MSKETESSSEKKTSRPIRISTSGLANIRISDETQLIRYMKLSSFLLLASKNILYVPTVQKLQESDPFEANAQRYYSEKYWATMWPLVRPHKNWLLSDVLRNKFT